MDFVIFRKDNPTQEEVNSRSKKKINFKIKIIEINQVDNTEIDAENTWIVENLFQD